MPFKRTAVRRPAADPFADDTAPASEARPKDDDDDGLSLFRRSDKVFPRAVEEQAEIRRRKKEEQKRRSGTVEEEGSRKRISTESHDADPDGDKKRLRLSTDSEAGTESARRRGSDHDAADASRAAGSHITPPSTGSSRSRVSPRSLRFGEVQHRSESPAVILDDDDDAPAELETVKRQPVDSDSDVEVVEDRKKEQEPDEFEHYIIEARQREAARVAAAAARTQGGNPDGRRNELGLQRAELDDPPVLILIVSNIPGTVAVHVQRKMSQAMKLVIDTWVTQQIVKGTGLSRRSLEGVFLTWRGNKIYSTTSLESLGLKADSTGRIASSRTGSRFRSESPGVREEDGRSKVVFQMWTEKLYQDYLSEKERERRLLLGELDEDDDADERDRKLHVVLKAKGLEPTRLAIYTGTPISVVESAFKASNGMDPGLKLSLRFDGEDLQPDLKVGETEIEDEDNLEVYFK